MKGGSLRGGALAGLALAWLAGTALQLQERAAMPMSIYVAGLAVGLAMLAASAVSRRCLPVALLGVGLLGFAAAGVRASLLLAEALNPDLEGQTVEATGIVASLPQRGPDGLRFRFEVESARFAGQPVRLPSQLALGWYKGQREDAAVTAPRLELRAGQRWRFDLRLKAPHGSLNPYGFDYELNLFEQGIRATGYVHDARPLLMDRAAAHPVERLRQHVRDAIEAAVKDPHAAGVLAALSVGDQSAIARGSLQNSLELTSWEEQGFGPQNDKKS